MDLYKLIKVRTSEDNAYLCVNTRVTDEWLQNIKRLLGIPVNKSLGFSRVPRNVAIVVC
jgi:hypothetical protein